MAEATATGVGGRLQGVSLPARSPVVNPDSAHHGPRREPLDAMPMRRDHAGSALGREALDCRRGGERRQTALSFVT